MSTNTNVEIKHKSADDFAQRWFSKRKQSTVIVIVSNTREIYRNDCNTTCGTNQVDDPDLMQYLQAELLKIGNCYQSRLNPKVVIDRLLAIGFQIRGFSASNGGSLWWTLQD